MPKPVDVRIDRETPVPLYHQLAEQLSAAIGSGTLQPGDAFENEVAMAERLGLSRPTVRRAIQELVGQGLLLRRRGLGTTVAGRQLHRRAELTSLYDDLRREGAGDPRTEVLTHEVTTDEVAATATARSRSCATGCRPPTPTSAARTSSATASTRCCAPAEASRWSLTSASAPASRRLRSAGTSTSRRPSRS
jgi:DNA-binding transcriptional regulator YhcF (GntR family)